MRAFRSSRSLNSHEFSSGMKKLKCLFVFQALDLNNSDLIACTVLMKDGTKFRRFLVIDVLQLILVEPDQKKLGWGVAKLVGFLQDVEVAGDKDDSRCLHLTIHRGGATNANRLPILSAKFMFDDHIRCMAAKQRLTKGRSKARQKKMGQIAQLLEVPGQIGTDGGLSMYSANILRGSPASVGGGSGRVPREHRPLFSTANRCPGVASALRRDSSLSVVSRVQMQSNRSSAEHQTSDSGSQRRLYSGRRENSPNGTPVSSKTSREGSRTRQGGSNSPRTSREGSPRILRPRSEEIPLENFGNNSSSRGSNTPTRPSSRSSTPIRISNVSSVLETIPAVVSSSPKPSVVADQLAAIPCEETSFIGDEAKVKKKGGIETV
jgi:protein CLEC16A